MRCKVQVELLPLLTLNDMPLPRTVQEIFGDLSFIGFIQLNVDELLPTSLLEHPMIVFYFHPSPVLDFGILLRVPA